MKKAISVLLAVAIMLSQLALCAEATSDNPLQATDRITSQLASTVSRKQEIENARIQRENMKDAAYTYGVSADATNNLGFILNRKTMTKREFEAFKWSFIISQFAVPLEDSLIDVFSQTYFNSMLEQNLDISAVENFLTYGGTNPEEVKITSSMLQDANFTDIVDTIKSNYTILYLYRDDDSALYLSDLLYGEPALYERFYIYDTILSSADPNSINNLYYHQDYLAGLDTNVYDYDISEPTKIPVAVYDAQFYLYLQLAVGVYCLRNNVTVTELEALYGTAQIVIDSYGNICIYTSAGAKILMPNFGNSLLTAEGTSSQICFYNKWITTLYSRTQRTHAGDSVTNSDIFGSFSPIALGGNSYITLDDSSLSYETYSQGIFGQYLAELPYTNGSEDLSNKILLVDPADIVITASLLSATFDEIIDESNWGSLNPLIGKPQCYVMHRSENVLTSIVTHFTDYFYYGNEKDINTVYNGFHMDVTDKNSNDIVYNAYIGTIFSNVTKKKDNYVFTHSLATSTSDIFINPYPLFNTAINLASLDTNSNSGKTHYYKAAMSLKLGSWRYAVYNEEGNRSTALIYSSTSTHNASQMFLQGLNNCLVLVTTFSPDQMIQDVRFSSTRAARQDDGRDYTEIYLPFNIINIGQSCSAFFGEEKGMFVTKHNNYFSSDMETFRELFEHYFASILNTTGGDGSKAADQKINWSIIQGVDPDKAANTDFLVLQSGFVEADPYILHYLWWNTNETYMDMGLPVAISLPDNENLPNKNVWTPCETKDAEDNSIYDFSDLADYLQNIYDARNEKKDKEFWISPQYTVAYYQKDNSDKEDKVNRPTIAEFDQYKMRSGDGTYDMLIKRNSDTEWALTLFKFETMGEGHDKIGTITLKYDENLKYWIVEGYNGTNHLFDVEDNSYYFNETLETQFTQMLNFMGLIGEAKQRLESNADGSIANFKANLEGLCKKWGFDTEEVLYAFSCFQYKSIEDNTENFLNDIYFFDEYEYLLRNTSNISGQPGSQNSMDFAAIVYYWDRAYLPNLTFNKTVTDYVSDKFGACSLDLADEPSAYREWLEYEKLLKENGKDRLDYSFAKYIDDYVLKADGTLSCETPFVYELTLQTQSLTEFISENNTIQNYFDFDVQAYNYLDPDTIILYPCTEEAYETSSIYISSGLGETVHIYGYSADQDVNSLNYVKNYNYIDVLMALQCNTDYEHNYLAVAPVKAIETAHVTKEELMDKANEFFDNPVSSLEYILSGFLYKMHSTIATGSLGSVFSANWLLESDIYNWIIDRYVAIVTIIVVCLLLLKLTQFAMSKTRDYGSIGRAVAGILAMCMVPIIVFNGFIWVFDATSEWALAGPTNKMLLGEINYTVLGRVNNDPGTTAEYNAFREQFDSIEGEYNGFTFEEVLDYGFDDITYRQVPLSSYLNYIEFGTNYTNWYTSTGFEPVHMEHYDESMFYYFYDYIRSEFFNYIKSSSNASGSVTYIDILDKEHKNLINNARHSDSWEEAITEINSAEAGLAMQTGEFLAMLNDTNFVYSLSINPTLADRYGGAYAKDLAGVYGLFSHEVCRDGEISETTNDFIKALKNAPWRLAMNDADIIKVDDSINPELWTDFTVITDYCWDAEDNGNYRGHITGSRDSFYGRVVTSKLDLFDSRFNDYSNKVDMRTNELVLTPLEEKLCEVTTNIYEKTLKALEFHSGEIKNESAITLMALIATFEVSEAFDLEPAGPIPQTVTLDTVIRTAFIRDLDVISSNSNTMYSIIAQGDSFGKVFIIFVLELTIAIAGILRIFIILYLTVGSFVVLALRLLHKAPATSDLVYGIVGNVLALLALHALTLFLVVCAVEWVADATNSIPSLVLDLAVIAFIVLMCCMLFKLVKNLVKDAINMGGAKIKAGVHKMVGSITDFITHNAAIESLASELSANDVNIDATNAKDLHKELTEEEFINNRRTHTESIINNMSEVEDVSEDEAEHTTTNASNRVLNNVTQEREIAESDSPPDSQT